MAATASSRVADRSLWLRAGAGVSISPRRLSFDLLALDLFAPDFVAPDLADLLALDLLAPRTGIRSVGFRPAAPRLFSALPFFTLAPEGR
jgi:hypothetical protein